MKVKEEEKKSQQQRDNYFLEQEIVLCGQAVQVEYGQADRDGHGSITVPTYAFK